MKYWITPDELLDRSAFYYFSKTVNCSADAEISLRISADTRYQLRVNGGYVCEGPCAGDHESWRYEDVTVPRELLKDGDNLVSVRVLFIRGDGFHTVARRDRAALWVDGTVKDGDKLFPLASDESWICEVDHGTFLPNAPKELGIAPSIPPVQIVERDGDLRTVGVKRYCSVETEGDVPGRGSVNNYTPYGAASQYLLVPRTIPILKPEAPCRFRLIRSGEGFMELDAGVYTTAYPEFFFKGERGGRLRITYAECYIKKTDGHRIKGDREATDGEIEGSFDEIVLSGERQRFESHWYRAFRYVRLDFPVGTHIDLEEQVYRPFFYPLDDTGTFTCSDPIKNAMWKVSRNTLLCCTHELFVDCPYYEQCQYDMDSALEMVFMLRLTGDGRMARKAVVDLARSQRADGMLCANYPSIMVQVIPNFSLYWILMLRDYVTYTGDVGLAKELLSVAERVLSYFDLRVDRNGLCLASEYWNYLDWVDGWSRGVPVGGEHKPSTATTMLYSAALTAAASLALECKRRGLAEEYSERAERANAAVNAHCFDKERGMYVDVYGETPSFSEHTAVFAVLCGAAVGDEATALIDRVFGEGAAEVSHASFSFNYYVLRALEKSGTYGKYAPKVMCGWKKMLDMHCTTWCENPGVTRSECHAWSSAPIYELSAMVLGVQPLSTGYGEVSIAPNVYACESAVGTVPTPMGVISVSWETSEKGKLLKIKSPSGMLKHIKVGNEETVTDAEAYTVLI